MGRGSSLTDHAKGMIDAFEKDGHSQQENQQIKNDMKQAISLKNYDK